MSYIDSLLENIKDDTYSWKNVSDPGFRAGFGVEQQVSDELTGANGFNGMSRGKAERIAQIKKRLAEIAEEKKKYDIEDAMGRYKFLYDNDPSVLTNYRQQKRTEKMNADMRKATEAASKESNLQTAWKQNGIDLEVAKYDLAAAQNAYNEAHGNNDVSAMNRAMTDIKRAKAKFDRVSRENDILRDKMMKTLGVAQGDEQKLESDVSEVDYGHDFNKDLADAEAIKKLDGNLELLDKDIVVDNINVDKKTKLANVQKWLANIEQAKKDVDASPLSTEQKNTRNTKLADLEAKVRSYAKPKGKGGQGTKMTKDDYQKELDSLVTKSQLIKKGYKWLKAAKDAGATHTLLDTAIGVAAGE